jgi:hypothetical protein
VSEQEEFIARWMRLKREQDSEAQPKVAETQPAEVAQLIPPAPIGAESALNVSALLPAVESITGESDIRLFLQSGVPTELVRAALRAAWATDPAIREFVGIAESQWDFNDPGAMPGFGPLSAERCEQSVVTPSIPHIDSVPNAVEHETTVVNSRRDGLLDGVWLSSGGQNCNPVSEEPACRAPQPHEDNRDSKSRRHGSALPK